MVNKIRDFFKRIREAIGKIPLKSYVTFLLESIGLFANIIAIVSYFGASNTPVESPNFYINNQEFFAWSTLAIVYTLGIILARMKRRWRRIFTAKSATPKRSFLDMVVVHNHDDYDWLMFKRNFAFTLVVSLPLTFLYVRAIQTSASPTGFASPWGSLFTTVLISVPITFAGIIVSAIFDNALSLYEGD